MIGSPKRVESQKASDLLLTLSSDAAILAVSDAAVMAGSFAPDDARAGDDLVGNTGNAQDLISAARSLGVDQPY